MRGACQSQQHKVLTLPPQGTRCKLRPQVTGQPGPRDGSGQDEVQDERPRWQVCDTQDFHTGLEGRGKLFGDSASLGKVDGSQGST